ncbi:MAG TPA: oxidoreductase [Verrucomicrobiae bacterium]|nr:oxidoreductase [Verrucomicrobiae bacterium]
MKPKVAFYWCASCGGCEECILDLAEDLLPVLDAVEIVFWPVALDFKEHDIQPVDICFLNGAVRTSEQKRMAELLRANAKVLVAFGACAQLGGIPGLANLSTARDILETAEEATGSDGDHGLPLPELFDTVLPIDRVVDVDYYVPGCPPTPKIIGQALTALLKTEVPSRHSVLAPEQALCEECPRRATRPETLALDRFRRVADTIIDENMCILAQGIPCLGPATRAGCEGRCIAGNMPCTGCFGPAPRVRDFGAKALSAMASILAPTGDDEITDALRDLPDPAGTFYRYSLPASFLTRKATP